MFEVWELYLFKADNEPRMPFDEAHIISSLLSSFS